MDLQGIPQLFRNANRFNEVVGVVLKYGIAPWLGNLQADWIQRHLRNKDGDSIAEMTHAQRVRMALTELGTTFIKLGQILSTRADLIGPDVAEELTQLQSNTPADAPEEVIALLTEELGKPPDELFQAFDPVAFASASIGQVHHAVLRDGTEVVVKVQHTGIEDRVRNDVEILVQLAELAEAHWGEAAQYNPVDIAQEFQKTLLAELDFTREQRNLVRFAENFEGYEGVKIPQVYPDYCSRRVLTMERLMGISVSDKAKLEASGFDLCEIARRGAEMFLKMVFRDGFYHADPHPGNLMVVAGGEIGLLDCGMVGRVDETLREQVEDLLLAAIDRDGDGLLDTIVELGEPPPDFDRVRLRNDLIEFLEEYATQSIKRFDLSGALNEMTEIIRRHRILLPSRVSLLIKMLVMLEGTSRQLNPDFNIVELIEPYRAEAIQHRLSPKRILRKVKLMERDWRRLAESLPSDVRDIVRRLRTGRFDVYLEHRRLDSIVNRLVLGLLTSALFVGSTSLLSSGVRPMFHEVSVPGAIGCAVSLWMAIMLARAIRRSGNI